MIFSTSKLTVGAHIDLTGRIITQIGGNLFAYRGSLQLLMKLTNLSSGQITKEELSNSLNVRCWPSLTSFDSRYLFVTGGSTDNNKTNVLASMEMYDISCN